MSDTTAAIRALHVDDERRRRPRPTGDRGGRLRRRRLRHARPDRGRISGAVRETHPDLPFIVFTGRGSETVAIDAISAGATDYLQKKGGDEQFELLANRIRNAVSRYRAERSERRLLELAENTDRDLYVFAPDFEETLFVNSAHEGIWGQPSDRLREDPAAFLRGLHPDDRERAREVEP